MTEIAIITTSSFLENTLVLKLMNFLKTHELNNLY